jgi:D-3-phosphoglycerate dehydrogenase
MKAIILAPFEQASLHRLQQRLQVLYESWMESGKMYDPEELGERLCREGISIVVTEIDFLFRETFEKAPGLKLVAMCRAGTNQVDLESATELGVAVVHTPQRNAVAVAELTVGLLLSLARRIPQAHAAIISKHWESPLDGYLQFRGVELSGKTAGILGLGAIGSLVAQRLLAFQMRVLAHDPYLPAERAKALGVELADLETVLKESDFLSLHLPLTPETEGLLSAQRLRLMKPTAYLINTGSGGVLDEDVLAEALRQRAIAGAALDVFGGHPLPPTSPLLALDNVVLTPHIGGATQETVQRYSEMVTEDILRFLDGQRPLHLANPEVWKQRR